MAVYERALRRPMWIWLSKGSQSEQDGMSLWQMGGRVLWRLWDGRRSGLIGKKIGV
jgi:hypothetical protein